jgi:hypothetical protein
MDPFSKQPTRLKITSARPIRANKEIYKTSQGYSPIWQGRWIIGCSI